MEKTSKVKGVSKTNVYFAAVLKQLINKTNYYLRLSLVWMIMFHLYRIVFLITYNDYLKGLSSQQVLGPFWEGIRIDLSTTGYLVGISFVFYEGSKFITKERVFNATKKIVFGLNILLAILFSLISGGELVTYGEWEGKLSAKVFTHLANPSEVFSTASTNDVILFLTYILLFVFIFVVCYKKVVYQREKFYARAARKNLMFFPLIGGVIFLVIRGGWQPIPIQLSNAYFSNNQFLNDVSVNSAWAFGNSLDKTRQGLSGNPFEFMKIEEAEKNSSNLFKKERNEAHSILTNTRPNIVFVVLESWSADVVKELGGYGNVTNEFDRLTQEGVLFDNFYGAGWTSDQAMAAMYSSAVVFPNFSIINNPEVFRSLPAVTEELHKEGYNSSYFFGGDLDYGNIKAYLMNKNFQKIKDEDVYDSDFERGKLGVQDGIMFNQFLKEIDELKEPFFTNLFTLSSHSPYDFPGSHNIKWGGDYNGYLNSIHYTDSCLGVFFDKARKKPWYSNTLFVIVADHSHVSPKKWNACSKEKSHVPLLFYGEVLKKTYKGEKIEKIGNHLDIPATLLGQMNLDASRYKFSKNLLDTTSLGFASFTFHNGFGWINADDYYGYTFNYERVYCRSYEEGSKKEVSIENEGNSFFQVAFEYFY